MLVVLPGCLLYFAQQLDLGELLLNWLLLGSCAIPAFFQTQEDPVSLARQSRKL